MTDKLQQAIAAIKAGDKQKGREIIAEIIKVDRGNEQAWLWLTQTDITHEQKIKSLQQVLRINPNNETAKQGLAKLQGEQATSPPQGGLLKKSASASEPGAPLEETKQCPYCAETIKAEAVVCRFCGQDLKAKGAVSREQEPKKKKGMSTRSVLILGLLFACVGLCAISSLMRSSLPSGTSNQPTSSSVEATPTDNSTSTNTPETKQDEARVALQIYFEAISTPFPVFTNGLQTMGELLNDYKPNDAEWKLQVGTTAGLIRVAHNELSKVNPPEQLSEVHAALMEAADECNASLDFLVSGLDNQNADILNQGIEHLKVCQEKFPEATKLLKEYMEQFD